MKEIVILEGGTIDAGAILINTARGGLIDEEALDCRRKAESGRER